MSKNLLEAAERITQELTTEEKVELTRRLERKVWGARMDAVVSRIRQDAPKLSQRTILRLCRDVRRERADRARRT